MTQGFTLSYSPYTLPNAMPLTSTAEELIQASSKPQTAPIFKLPPDIFYHILWNVSGRWVTLNPTADLWAVTRVSRSLRLVSLSFANLWARISLEPDDIRKYKRHAVDILRTVLERSMPLGRNEGAHLRLRVHVDMLLVHANLLDILTAHYTRWYSLDLHISLFLLNTLSAQMAPLGFPLLSHLRLSLGSDQTKIPDIDIFSLCPALESVEFDSIPRCKALRLPWARLTRLVVKERVRSDFLRMLLSAPALQHAELISVLPSLHPEDPNDDPLPKSRIIEHKSLKTLILKCIPFAVVLDSLYLPNLAELTLEHTAQASYGSLLGFLKRSNEGGKLAKLSLSGSLFLEEAEGTLTRSMSSSSLPSSLPPSPFSESGPAGSPFAPSSGNSNITSSPTSTSLPWNPVNATLLEVLTEASSLTSVVLEDWTPLRNPSPYDAFFIALSRSGEGDGGMGLLKSSVSFPGTPVVTSAMAAMSPGFAMTPVASLSRSNSLKSRSDTDISPLGPPVSAVPAHLQRTLSQSHSNVPAGLPPHLANNPHVAAASAHLAALGIQLTPDALTPSPSVTPLNANNADSYTPAPPGPFSPGFGMSPMTRPDSNFAKALVTGIHSKDGSEKSEEEAGRAATAVSAAHGVLGVPIDNEDVLLPNLKTITISNISKNVIDLHLLAGIVESRWRGWISDRSQSPGSSAAVRSPSPSIITSVSLYTDLRLIKNKGSVGRMKALKKEAEDNVREGRGEKVKIFVSGKRWGGI